MYKIEKDNQRVKCVDFLQKHPAYFRSQISIHFPLTRKQLSEFGDRLDWGYISLNENIQWNKDLIAEFQDKLDWYYLSQNPTAFKDESLLNVFVDKIDWIGTEGQIMDSIASNSGIFWDEELIERYEAMLDFEKLSSNENVPWSENLIDKYLDRWNYEELGGNLSVPWTLRLFDKYLGEEYLHLIVILWNHRLLSNIDFIDKYKESLEWYFICTNPLLPWKEKNLLEYWKKYVNGWGIAQNEALFEGDDDFFNKHLDKWIEDDYRLFKSLSDNKTLPWSIPFIEAYKSHWDWESLSTNEGLPWSLELIELFQDKWVWGCLYETSLLDENGFEISPTGGKALQSGLVRNKALPWSIDFINKYSKKIDFELIKDNHSVWEKTFKPHVDDVFISEFFNL